MFMLIRDIVIIGTLSRYKFVGLLHLVQQRGTEPGAHRSRLLFTIPNEIACPCTNAYSVEVITLS